MSPISAKPTLGVTYLSTLENIADSGRMTQTIQHVLNKRFDMTAELISHAFHLESPNLG